MLNHGGKLKQVAKEHQIPWQQWLDLSTGISPYSYPIPPIPDAIWHKLPQYDSELVEAAKAYYQASNVLATAGSQSIIQLLPRYRLQQGYPVTNVWLPKQGYKEHEKAWRDAGFVICHYQSLPNIDDIQAEDIVVVINPNNPTGELFTPSQLQPLYHRVKQQRGWLIVDEAFMDGVVEQTSLINQTDHGQLFVLRSLGKFFGLAGLRVGFVSAVTKHLDNLQEMLGPWHISGPAGYVAKHALTDKAWQQQQKAALKLASERLQQLLVEHYKVQPKGTYLFKTVYLANAEQAYQQLCKQGVYVRLTDEHDALRFGIPTPEQLTCLGSALASIS